MHRRFREIALTLRKRIASGLARGVRHLLGLRLPSEDLQDFAGRNAIERFCFIGSTGRTGSQFLDRTFSDSSALTASFHGDLFGRLGNEHPSAEASLVSYFRAMLQLKPGKSIYVECNPAFAEHVALSYGIPNAYCVFRLIEAAGLPVKCLYIVRNPVEYVRSLGAVGWMWDWVGLPFFETVHKCKRSEWENLDPLEKRCTAWVMKSRFFRTLTESANCIMVRFEDLFGPRVTDGAFRKHIEEICSFLGVSLTVGGDVLTAKRKTKVNVHNKQRRSELSPEEAEIVKRICASEMEALAYAI
jgi:hypothetical protein